MAAGTLIIVSRMLNGFGCMISDQLVADRLYEMERVSMYLCYVCISLSIYLYINLFLYLSTYLYITNIFNYLSTFIYVYYVYIRRYISINIFLFHQLPVQFCMIQAKKYKIVCLLTQLSGPCNLRF